MSNEMKLLMALCGALGFNVETIRDYREEVVKPHMVEIFTQRIHQERKLKHDGTSCIKDSNDNYVSILKEPVVSYKLTNKGGLS